MAVTRSQSRSASRPAEEVEEDQPTQIAKGAKVAKGAKGTKDPKGKDAKVKEVKAATKEKVAEESQEDAEDATASCEFVKGMMKVLIEDGNRREAKLTQQLAALQEQMNQQAGVKEYDDDGAGPGEWDDDEVRQNHGQQKRARMEPEAMASFTDVMERIAEKIGAPKKSQMDPFEERIVEMNHGVAFPDRIEYLAWNDPRVTLDPKMWVMILYRKAEKKTLEPLDFVYAEDSTYGPKMHELVASLQRRGVSPEDVDILVDIVRSWVYSFGVYKVDHADFSGAYAADERDGQHIYSRTLFYTIAPALKQAIKILQGYVKARVVTLRGDAAGKAYDNFEAMQATDLPIGAAGFVTQLSTKHLQLGDNRTPGPRTPGPVKCNACGAALGTTSFRDHNKVCPNKSKRGK